ncbi:c-type cytochrome [Halovulum dunhuangense]|uniref:C-type cytochrome n=1 Tax=Halovulum dunhuangense TaxID=1505036 RepID=A0A849L017_9RHOB|nr:c-type cytochrome [Halovulum dunhuangense]NNU78850.1 c-type cytochrome [Halovulum dunhuangense]
MAYRVAFAGVLAAPFLMLAACDPVERADARRYYAENCAACHGPSGRGDGPLAAGLETPPADLTTIARRNGGAFDFAHVMGVIDGYKSPERDMPRFGNLLAEAETIPFDTGDGILTPTPIPLLALARYIEAMQVP